MPLAAAIPWLHANAVVDSVEVSFTLSVNLQGSTLHDLQRDMRREVRQGLRRAALGDSAGREGAAVGARAMPAMPASRRAADAPDAGSLPSSAR
jgi:hypothetical protein